MVQFASCRSGASGVIRSDKSGLQFHGIFFEHLPEQKSREYMGTNNCVKFSGFYKTVQLLRAIRQQLVDCRVIIQHRRMFFRKTVAKSEQLGDMPVHSGMPPIHKL